MEIKSPIQFNLESRFGSNANQPRGAMTDFNFKSQSNYSMFNTPKIFNRESSQMFVSCKTLLRFDENNINTKENQNTDGSQPVTQNEKGFFAKAQVSRYKNSYIPFSSGKKIPEASTNKENSESEFSTPKEDSNTKNPRALMKGVSYPTPRNLFQSLSQNNPSGKQAANMRQLNGPTNIGGRNLFGSNTENTNNGGLKTPDLHKSSSSSPFNKPFVKQQEVVPFDARKLKREAQLSPRSKSYFDDIEKKRKDANSKCSSTELLNYYMGLMPDTPPRYHWKIFLELAEAFKKECNYNYAKSFYKIAIHMQPYNPDIWLEYAKMEEDYGNLNKVKDILKQGIHYNPMNENLIIKFLRVEEKFGRIEESRRILSKLKHCNIEKSWKLYLEGAMLEAKLGNPKSAQRIFKMLIKNLEMQGNVYLEFAKFEENMGNLLGALKISYDGLSKNIRFSNLWGYFMRICERIVEKFDYIPLDNYLNLANDCLPKDMLWKIYLEIAGVAERKNDFYRSKNFITKAILSCPENVKWKCFVMGARMELKDQGHIKAKKIINRFIENANEKQKYHLLIESSKISEYVGDLNTAISYFEDTKDYMRAEWKVYLEYIHMLTRNNQFDLAYQVAKESLYHHNLAGRLWASLIQLKHISGFNNPGTDAYKIFLIAINEVPKSGEVWCEGGRICLNPHSDRFDINKAKQFLNFAIYFTPQYGDSFVEAIRLYLLLGDKKELANLKKKIINSQPNYGNVWQFLKTNAGENVHETWKNAKRMVKQDIVRDAHLYRIRMNDSWESNCPNPASEYQILTACTDYNLILQGKKYPTTEERWKLIFHTDQSLL